MLTAVWKELEILLLLLLVVRFQVTLSQKATDGQTQLCEKVSADVNEIKTMLRSIASSSKAEKPRDCTDVMASGFTTSGVYTVHVGRLLRPVKAYCDMTTDYGGWLVFQKRKDGSEDFYRNWADYATGFGNPNGEFWLGNDNIYRLTNTSTTYVLRIDLEDFDGNTRYAEYNDFKIGSSVEHFRLRSIGGYSGNAGDGLTYHLGQQFSTYDRDNDGYTAHSSAQRWQGAWWYSSGHYSNLNGRYLNGSTSIHAQGVTWREWHGHKYSLKISEMKIRPADA